MQRLAPARVLAAVASPVALTFSNRPSSTERPGDKKKKVNLDDDDRWLEAEFDEKLRTPEERYAHERQRELMKSLIAKMRSEHTEKLQDAVNERNAKIEDLKGQMAEIEKKLQELNKEK